jgi:1-acyl-sn-glycerol-3-phosphate acyltransferase
VPKGYRILRWLVRLGLAVFYPKIRLLHAESMPAAVATLLAVSHPPSLRDALILVAAFEVPVRCRLPERLFQAGWRKFLAKGLGMIPYNPEVENSRSALDRCCDALAKRQAVAVFADSPGTKAGEAGKLGRVSAALALEAETRHSGQLGLAIAPVYLLLPLAPRGEWLVYADDPIYLREYLGQEGRAFRDSSRALAIRVEKACQENAFRLQGKSVQEFLSDLEEILRADLEEDWASRPGWKQKVEGFELSRFVADWTEQINYLDPGQLVALGEAVDEYREARRRWSLRQLDIEAGGKWLSSRWGRAAIWIETAVGLPVACYGLANHLLAWLLLFWFGLLKNGSEPSSKKAWVLRALVVLGCYSAQVLLCAHWLGRSAAGFYAPSLPLTGAYLWRYHWLLRQRTRRALAAFRHPAQGEKLRQRRKELLGELNRALEDYAESLGVAH